MDESKTFLIVNAVPNTDDMVSFQSYLSQIVGIFKQYGGSGIFNDLKPLTQIMGKGGIKAIAVVEFPSAQAVTRYDGK